MNKHDIRDGLVLVTGGSSGIGKELARQFLQKGSRVIIVSENCAKLKCAIRELSEISDAVSYRVCDLSDADSIAKLARDVMEHFGCPDILVNNAGFGVYRTFESSDIEEIEMLLSVNLLAAVRLTKAFLGGMVARRSGIIVNMASIAGRMVITPNATYCGAKHALVGWGSAIREELRHFGISVLSICPGRVNTPFFDHVTFRERSAGPETMGAISAERVARATLEAIEKKRKITYVPAYLGILVWLQCAAPFILRWLYERTVQQRIEAIYTRHE